jgi:radical SAM superfamily enzyme YgiQ (UPF0313 family)
MPSETHLPRGIALVSPLRGEEKHPANPLAVHQRFLNFGALSLATYLTKNGWPSRVVDEYCLPENGSTTDAIAEYFGPDGPRLLGVSCISAYSADRAREVLVETKTRWPDTITIIGGQHFVGYWGRNFAQLMPEADILIAGEAEAPFLHVANELGLNGRLADIPSDRLPAGVHWRGRDEILSGSMTMLAKPSLDEVVLNDVNLYPGSKKLFPSVEFSRGCPFFCVFCANTRENRQTFRRASPTSVSTAVGRLLSVRTERPVQFYMQASNFSVTPEEAKSLSAALAAYAGQIAWRTEVRVDGVRPEAIEHLAAAGLRVLDLGLESASRTVLRIMNKTNDPENYLQDATRLLRAASDAGIFTKVNYLIHPGDTYETIEESRRWLMEHSPWINGISSGVALEYPGTPLSTHLETFARNHGTQRLQHPLSRWGVFNLKPSESLSNEQAATAALEIAQLLQTRSAFVVSKSFGYLGSGFDLNPLVTIPEASHGTPYRAD